MVWFFKGKKNENTGKEFFDDEKTVVEGDKTVLNKKSILSEDKTEIIKPKSSDKTILETPFNIERDKDDETVVETHVPKRKRIETPSPLLTEITQTGTLSRFKDWNVIKEFPAEGGEADIYLVKREDEYRVLKLYRRGMEPKPEVLKKIKEITEEIPKYVIKLYEYGKDKTTGRWYELLEYAKYGNLKQFLKGKNLTKTLLKLIIYEINEGLKALHSKNIIHRDLKPSNLLVRSVRPFNIVFSDFGISSVLDEGLSKKMTTVKGTPIYSAPEAFTGVVGKSADYWSLGMIILELLDRNPLKGLNMQNIMYQLTVKNIPIPEHIDDDLKLLLKGLLTRDPKKRWGYNEVKRWLAGDRNIPVYYENEVDKEILKKPYKFGDREFYSLEEIAAAFLESPESFELAERHMARGYLIKWLELNKDYDKATQIENLINELELPDEMVIRFAYQYVEQPFSLYGIKITPTEIIKILYKYINKINLRPEEIRLIKNLDRLPYLYTLAVKSNKKLYNSKLHDFLENLKNFVDINKVSTVKNFIDLFKKSVEFLKNKDAIKPTDFKTVFEPLDKFPEELPKGIITHSQIDSLKKFKKEYFIPEIIFDKNWDTKTYNEIYDFIKKIPENLLKIEEVDEISEEYILPIEVQILEELPISDYKNVVEYFRKNKDRFLKYKDWEEIINNYLVPVEVKDKDNWNIQTYERILSFLSSFKDELIPLSKLSEDEVNTKITLDNYKDIKEAQELIFTASKKGNLNDVKLAVRIGANINKADEMGNTPLHWAALKGHLDVVKFLVENGADINKENNKGDTPLSLAFPLNLSVVRYLAKKGGKGFHKTLKDLLKYTLPLLILTIVLLIIYKPVGYILLIPTSIMLFLTLLATVETIFLKPFLGLGFILSLLLILSGIYIYFNGNILGLISSVLGGIILIGLYLFIILRRY